MSWETEGKRIGMERARWGMPLHWVFLASMMVSFATLLGIFWPVALGFGVETFTTL